MTKGKVVSVNVSDNKGEKKHNIGQCKVIRAFGLENDAHGGFMHRQISLLSAESIEKMRTKGVHVGAGDFAENLTVEGIDLPALPIGTTLRIGESLFVRVTQIGKECHSRCAIFQQVGDCVMPREGIFVEVLNDGTVSVGDEIEVVMGLRAHIITVSDKGSAGHRVDRSGPEIRKILEKTFEVTGITIIPDEVSVIAQTIIEQIDEKGVDVVVTTGGTGVSKRDVTPEATRSVIDRELPGFAEVMRMESYKITPHSIISRAICGIRRESIIINLPGSPKAATECLTFVLGAIPHALSKIKGDQSDCGG
ncbi:MAG: MOSC domain-containing protein [Syntrophobacterales bacterium]|jgi:molybdenum cofactor synthesis domain-containing protein|nr:MOSC domain-containing protein [Syntrophobacterales bacterium]